MSPTDPREPDGFPEPDGVGEDPPTSRWSTLGAGGDASDGVPESARTDQDFPEPNPGPRLAALGVIVAVVAIPVGALALLADFGALVWLAGAAVLVAAAMIGFGYREWRANAER
jgi:hypothetical protein